jgi:hypothetical protein
MAGEGVFSLSVSHLNQRLNLLGEVAKFGEANRRQGFRGSEVPP